MQQRVVISLESSTVWNGGEVQGTKSLVGSVQVLSDKSATTREITALVPYFVHGRFSEMFSQTKGLAD